jgi:hypothetical protein
MQSRARNLRAGASPRVPRRPVRQRRTGELTPPVRQATVGLCPMLSGKRRPPRKLAASVRYGRSEPSGRVRFGSILLKNSPFQLG